MSMATAQPSISSPPPSSPMDELNEGDPEELHNTSLMELAVIPNENDGTTKECTFKYEGRPCQLCSDEPSPEDPSALKLSKNAATGGTVEVLDLTDGSASPPPLVPQQGGCCTATMPANTADDVRKINVLNHATKDSDIPDVTDASASSTALVQQEAGCYGGGADAAASTGCCISSIPASSSSIDDANVLSVLGDDATGEVVVIDLTDGPSSFATPVQQGGCCATGSTMSAKNDGIEDEREILRQEEAGTSNTCCATQIVPVQPITASPGASSFDTSVARNSLKCAAASIPPPDTTTPTPRCCTATTTSDCANAKMETSSDGGGTENNLQRVKLKEAMNHLAMAMTLTENHSYLRAMKLGQISEFTAVKNCEIVGPASNFALTAAEFVYVLNDQCNTLVEEVLMLRKMVDKSEAVVHDAPPCCTGTRTSVLADDSYATVKRAALADVSNADSEVKVTQQNRSPKRPRTGDCDNTAAVDSAPQAPGDC